MSERVDHSFKSGEGRISGSLSLLLGALSFGAVICFHFPEYFTTPEIRKLYPIDLFRKILFLFIMLSTVLGIANLIRNRNKRFAIWGMIFSVSAFLMGGWKIETKDFETAAIYIGLDWMILDLLILIIVFIPLEKLLPKWQNQQILRPEWKTDLTYFCLGHLLIQLITVMITAPSTLIFSGIDLSGFRGFITSLPFAVQLIVTIFFTDLAQAFMHRLFHTSQFLWRFHSIHHSIKHLDWLAGSRLHLLDIFLTRSFGFIPIFILGISQDVIAVYAVIVATQTVVIHSNTRLNFGYLKYIIVTPQYHHWHHSGEIDTYNKNYAVHLTIIDHLMGTYYLPENKWPEKYGINEYIPLGYVNQFFFPLKKRTELD